MSPRSVVKGRVAKMTVFMSVLFLSLFFLFGPGDLFAQEGTGTETPLNESEVVIEPVEDDGFDEAAFESTLQSMMQQLESGRSSAKPGELAFTAIVAFPDTFHQVLSNSVLLNQNALPKYDSFTVTSFEQYDEWMQVIVVPTYIVDAGWEVPLLDEEIVEFLIWTSPTNRQYAFPRGTDGYQLMTRTVPSAYIDYSAEQPESRAVDNEEYKFPWTSGQQWFKTNGWHGEGSRALDFQPQSASGSFETNYAVLAAASGRLWRVCGPDSIGQAALAVTKANGTSKYLHLDNNSVPNIINQTVPRGQYIGHTFAPGRYYNGNCGYGANRHLHLVLPTQDMTIDGHEAKNVANLAFATLLESTNARVNGCPGKYKAEYYNGVSLSGEPVFVTCESINKNWKNGGPGNGVNNDNFSVRWTRSVEIKAGSYNFIALADDGINVWLGDDKIISGWKDQSLTEYVTNRKLDAGTYDIRVEYYEKGGDAQVRFGWEGSYKRLTAKHSGKCMDVSDSSKTSGALIRQMDCQSSDSQLWNMLPVGNGNSGYYTLRAKHSGKCLDVYGASLSDNAKIVQWDCNKKDNQSFKKESSGSYVVLRAKHSNKCVDVYRKKLISGGPIDQYTCNGQDNQSWSLQSNRRMNEGESGSSEMNEEPISVPYMIAWIDHTVFEGDSLELMASVYETTVQAIVDENPELSIQGLQFGMSLRVPVTVPQDSIPQMTPRIYLPTVNR